MQYDSELYKILFAWIVAYAILEPFVALFSHFLSVWFGIKSVYELQKTSPLLVVGSEFTYMTIVFVKTMWVYKHVLKKEGYYPRKNNVKDFVDFIKVYIVVHVVIDVLWAIAMNSVGSKLRFLDFLNKYSHELGVFSVARPLIYGIILLLFTHVIMYNVGDLEAVGAFLFSLFAVIVASF
jgi:hypothetical protein